MEHEAVKNPVISVGDWMLTLFILAIPLVNIIFLFIWAFSGDANPSKATKLKHPFYGLQLFL